MTDTDLVLKTLVWLLIIWAVLVSARAYLIFKNRILQEQIAQLKSKIIYVNIEKYNGIFYLYEKDSGRFITQGNNMSELTASCELMFKNHLIVIDHDDLRVVLDKIISA